MITEIKGQNIKGLEFSQALDVKTLVVGDNGAGKSARTAALTLLLLGHCPGVAKTNGEILDALSSDSKLVVGATIDGKAFSRRFVRSDKGSVRQDFFVEKRPVKKDVFINAMAKAGAPTLFDLSAFMAMSDAKKIDYIFDLFPPAGDIAKIQSDIEAAQESVNASRRSKKAKEDMLTELSKSRGAIDMPAGTAAEVQAEIEATEKELEQARENLETARLEFQRRHDEEERERHQAQAQQRQQQAETENSRAKAGGTGSGPQTTGGAGRAHPGGSTAPGGDPAEGRRQAAEDQLRNRNRSMGLPDGPPPDPVESIQRIRGIAQQVNATAVVFQCAKELRLFAGRGERMVA